MFTIKLNSSYVFIRKSLLSIRLGNGGISHPDNFLDKYIISDNIIYYIYLSVLFIFIFYILHFNMVFVASSPNFLYLFPPFIEISYDFYYNIFNKTTGKDR